MNNAFKIALQEYGVKEIVGSKHNPRVLEYFAKVGHSWVKDDETSWCAAFVGFCLETAGMKSTRALNARSYLNIGTPTTKPEVGDIVVLWRNSPTSWEGHVGFFIKETPTGILILGGNQSNQVFIAEYPKNQLLGYRSISQNTSDCNISKFSPIELLMEAQRQINDIMSKGGRL